MYASMGYGATEYQKLGDYPPPPMGIKFSDRPNGFGAFSKVALAGWPKSEDSYHLFKDWCEKQHKQQAEFIVSSVGVDSEGGGEKYHLMENTVIHDTVPRGFP